MDAKTIKSIINIILLAITHDIENAIGDIIQVDKTIVIDCLNIINTVWVKKEWYNLYEFQLFSLKLLLDNDSMKDENIFCIFNVPDLYEEWNRSKSIFIDVK